MQAKPKLPTPSISGNESGWEADDAFDDEPTVVRWPEAPAMAGEPDTPLESLPDEIPPPPPPPPPTASKPPAKHAKPRRNDLGKKPSTSTKKGGFQNGQLDYLIPGTMFLGKRNRCTINIAGMAVSASDLKVGLGSVRVEAKITNDMGVVLQDASEESAFSIEAIDHERQAILPGEITTWRFDVIPKKLRKKNPVYRLRFKVTAHLGDTQREIPLLEKTIRVLKSDTETTPQRRIVFMGANVDPNLDLTREAEMMMALIEQPKSPYQFTAVLELTAFDLATILKSEQPSIVHYAGHSTVQDFVLFGKDGEPTLASKDAIVALFKSLSRNLRVECFMLNSCFSKELGEAFHKYIKVIVGTTQKLPDETALEFSRSFYSNLADNLSFKESFDASVAMLSVDLANDDIDELYRFIE